MASKNRQMEHSGDQGIPELLAAKVPCSPALALFGTAPSGSPRVGVQSPRASQAAGTSSAEQGRVCSCSDAREETPELQSN